MEPDGRGSLSAAPTIARGMILLVREEGNDVRFTLWTVSAIRGKTVTLLRDAGSCEIKATATFPDGKVVDPWQVFTLSQNDLRLIFETRAAGGTL